MSDYTLRLLDLSGTTIADPAPFSSLGAVWDLDGPGSVEVALAESHVAPIPTDGLQVWYRADTLELPDGAAVSEWRDISGNGKHLSQGTASKQPVLRSSVLNGRPVVRFDGVDDALTTAATVTTPTDKWTAIWVFAYNGNPSATNRRPWSFRVTDSPTGLPISGLDNNDTVPPHSWHAWITGASPIAGTPDYLANGQFTIASASYELLNPGARMTVWRDGASPVTATDAANPTVSTWPVRRLGVGGDVAGSQYAPVDIAELLMWDRLLADAERQQVERALAWRWRLSAPEPLWLAGRRRAVLLRDGTPVWQGHVTGLDESKDARGSRYRARGLGTAAALADRVVLGGLSRTGTVATDIAWDLIQHAQAQPNGSLGITLGTVSGTAPALTRHYCDGDGILEAIDELASREPGGFDWEVGPDLKWNAWVGGRGTDRTATVAVGPEDVSVWELTDETHDLATYAHGIGNDPDGPCGPAMVTRSSALAGTYIRRDAVVERDTSSSGELQAAADHELAVRARARRRLVVTVHEVADPKGLAGLELGDKVTVYTTGGPQAMRLVRREVTLEAPALATWQLTFEVAS